MHTVYLHMNRSTGSTAYCNSPKLRTLQPPYIKVPIYFAYTPTSNLLYTLNQAHITELYLYNVNSMLNQYSSCYNGTRVLWFPPSVQKRTPYEMLISLIACLWNP